MPPFDVEREGAERIYIYMSCSNHASKGGEASLHILLFRGSGNVTNLTSTGMFTWRKRSSCPASNVSLSLLAAAVCTHRAACCSVLGIYMALFFFFSLSFSLFREAR